VAERVTIDWLGARGDGVAATAEGPVFVASALPGETVEIERAGDRARLFRLETASPDRVEPFCPYYDRCGGCVAQHMSSVLMAQWKRGIVAGALEKAGLVTEVADLVDGHGAGRRRITLHARQSDGAMRVGLMAARSHDLIEIATCPVTEPALAGASAVAQGVAQVLARSRKPLDLQVTATGGGYDVDVRGHGAPSERDRRELTAAAEALDLARLSIHGDVVVARREATIDMGRAVVLPPPGSFLQATAAGEDVLTGLVRDAVGPAKRVADLFAGAGPFSLRLAERAEVHAVESDGPALVALDRAARATPGLRRVTTETRDLFRRPLLILELDRFDAVVLDPPRAGAEAQVKQLAGSKTPVVAYVSCDPGSFARDAAILVRGGYKLELVTPVDQFKWSAHVELVGVFRKAAVAKRRR
jgi:23S rRNA (uracil1939-C5)-methyltransferase